MKMKEQVCTLTMATKKSRKMFGTGERVRKLKLVSPLAGKLKSREQMEKWRDWETQRETETVSIINILVCAFYAHGKPRRYACFPVLLLLFLSENRKLGHHIRKVERNLGSLKVWRLYQFRIHTHTYTTRTSTCMCTYICRHADAYM